MDEILGFIPTELYKSHLSKIGKVYFTHREIDVISCLLHARGTSKIASLLSSGVKDVTTRTIERHIHNIMQKIGCNTRDGIIDYIEKTDKFSCLRKYYSLLQINLHFENFLISIAKLCLPPFSCNIIVQEKTNASFTSTLKLHLGYLGIKTVENSRKNRENVTLLIRAETFDKDQLSLLLETSAKLILLLSKNETASFLQNASKNREIIELNKYQNYYLFVFDLLIKLFPAIDLQEYIKEYQRKVNLIPLESMEHKVISNKPKKPQNYLLFYQKYPLHFRGVAIFILLSLSSFSFFYFSENNSQNYAFRSDLIIPKESAFLNRPEFIAEIDNKLNKVKGLQTLILLGPGGSGKTTLARQYGCYIKESSVWEINAETIDTLKTSFEKLATILAKTDIEQQTLNKIQRTPNLSRREQKILQFVKEKLKLTSTWLLIYDNVEAFSDIQNYFPCDVNTWGQGKVILTSRNSNIENNKHINNVIIVNVLTPDQKFSLFNKIANGNNATLNLVNQTQETKLFLENIPAFPLDISLAAYYIKATGISYKKYLENILNDNKNFSNEQENLLKDVGDYTRTRYNIIVMSLQKLINTHEDFKDLLLMLGLINSQNVPLDLLKNFKNEFVVNSLIHNLKKYSFITAFSKDKNSSSKISIHRSMQNLILPYFIETYCLQNNIEPLKFIAKNIESYLDLAIREEDLDKMYPLISHCEIFLKHTHLLTPEIEAIIKGRLGIVHYFYGNNIKAKDLFEESILTIEQLDKSNSIHTPLFSGYLGNVYRDLGNYEKGREFLKKSIKLYKKIYPQGVIQYSYFIIYLGIIERYLGNYEDARQLFEQGLLIHHKDFSVNKEYEAWAYGQLGVIEKELGNYEKAEKMLEISLNIIRKEYHPYHFQVAWVLEHLSAIYICLKNYKKAKQTLEECLKVYASLLPDKIGSSWIFDHSNLEDISKLSKSFEKISTLYPEHFHDNYIYVAWPLRQLAVLHMKLGNYEKAKIILEQTHQIYHRNYGEEDIQTAANLKELGQLYLATKEYETAYKYLLKSSKIFEKFKHPESYSCLENLGQLFAEKSLYEMKKGNQQLSINYQKSSISYLTEALKVVKIHFGEPSPHIIRIQEKLKTLNSKLI